jgi:UDP-N-acetylglucosamine--N-acetylmuramyl-(pentapeptide) pyrophosphoryl-undecaprenol N-acetylglucosamine transferase
MIIAGGGTGGHLFPGLAVAEVLATRAGASVLFVGSRYGIEATAVPRTRFPFQALAIRGLRRRGLSGVAAFAWQLPVALAQAWRIVGAFRPALVLGLGGYGSVPVVLAAWLRGVPSVLLEQNVHPGLANRLLVRLARRVCTAFAESARYFPAGKTVQTGNPVRQLRTNLRPSKNHFTIFVFGGSQGARTINRAAVGAAGILAQQLPGLRVIHQTGAADEEWVREQYREMGVTAEVLPFVNDMGDAYGQADLVVCRAGATTLAELTAMGKAAILVPYPFAVDDHQRANAEVLARGGAAELIADSELTGEMLARAVLGLARDRARLTAMGTAARQLAVPDAAAHVAEVCVQVAAEGGMG